MMMMTIMMTITTTLTIDESWQVDEQHRGSEQELCSRSCANQWWTCILVTNSLASNWRRPATTEDSTVSNKQHT